MKIVEKAMAYASSAHAEINQYRNSYKLPYIVHPYEVMKRLATWGINDEEILAAAVLHDVVEDTKITISDLKKEFSGRIVRLVALLTRPDEDSLSFMEKFNYLKTFKTKDFDSILIKIADRWANTLDYFSIKKKRVYAGKYAAQCHPVYRAFLEQNILHNEHPPHVYAGVIEALQQLEDIVKKCYNTNYSIYETSVEEVEIMFI